MSATSNGLRRQMDSIDLRTVEKTVAKHTQPLADSIRNIELSVAKMSGSLEEHKTSVDRQLDSLTQSSTRIVQTTGELAGTVKHHEAELQELFRAGKSEKKSRFSFTPSHLTLALWLALGLVVIAGAIVGVDVLDLWK